MIKSERERKELIAALNKALTVVENTVSWAEARGFTDSQEYIDWENKVNQLSVKDHNIEFFNYKYMD